MPCSRGVTGAALLAERLPIDAASWHRPGHSAGESVRFCVNPDSALSELREPELQEANR
jgi:hypothetical protein